MAHRDGGGFDRLIVMISGAQERDERAARVLGTESNIAVARKDGFDTICPSRGRHHLERVAFGMKEISSWRDARELDVPIEPWVMLALMLVRVTPKTAEVLCAPGSLRSSS